MAAHMDSETDDDVLQVEDDYYTFLNIGKNATTEEITNAYRRLSKIYHPDKHADPLRKRDAEVLFNKTRKAYDVLLDPHKRAIYDTLGVKGLETDGWQIVQRTKTPQEIREEYERLAREQEERRLQQRTNPKGSISVGIDATDLFEAYYDDDTRGFLPQMEINSMTISQSIEAPLSLNDTVTMSGNLSAQNGTGSGNVVCSLRHIVSPKMWSEFEIGAGNGLLCGFKGFRTLSKRSFASAQGLLQVTPIGLRPGCNLVLARQLGKHTVGYLTWKAGLQSAMNTTVVWDTSYGHFIGALQFGIPNTFGMVSYTYKFPDEGRLKGSIKVGTFGAIVEYGCERKISQHNTVGATMVIGIPTGITLKLRLNRATQSYVFPIFLSEEPLPIAIFYGTVTPLVAWYILQTFVIVPYTERQRQREAKRAREANAAKLAERKKEAEAAVALMSETYLRIKSTEEAKGGLVIIEALYGNFSEEQENNVSQATIREVVDVRVPLQCLVKDSHLMLTDASKSNLPGFYDPCLGEPKSLHVRYRFRNLEHEVRLADEEAVRIPKESHLMRSS
ncbi:dnaJ homolog subfamily C member 11 [Dermacentor andersoni]|uniref:dnaJ homolog subfamily C member 11 n=1 Tax=Dermacentor andersoni TaxID=34620 RepID=UPI002155E40D|nr:dnaJ homolog subfamily C member 11-like [Dermacentor andersoni]